MFARKKTFEELVAEYVFTRSPDAYWVADPTNVVPNCR